MNDPLISVIIPVYRVEAYLDRCVESVVGQTYQNLEIILVDDGSPDRCPKMCDEWAEKDDRIRVIHKTNGGLSDARNAGMAIATGAYIGFVDSDDWIGSEMYEKLLNAIRHDHSDIAACDVQMVWEDGRPERYLTKRKSCVLDRIQAQETLLSETLLKQPVWYKLYRADLIRTMLFPIGKWHEDVFWSYRAIGAAKRISLVPYTGYFYWQRADSIMGARYSMRRLDAMEAMEERYQYLKKAFPTMERKARLSILGNCIYSGTMAYRYMSPDDRKIAMRRLIEIRKRYRFNHADYADDTFPHRVWFTLARISLPLVCRIKCLLGVGL